MKTNIIAIAFILYATVIAVALGHAQDTKVTMDVGTVTLDVEVAPAKTDVCTRVDAKTLSCTRLQQGKSSVTFIVHL